MVEMVKMQKQLGAIFLLVLIGSCQGNKQQNLQHLIKELKGESDNVANEIYTWIDQHKSGFQTSDRSRDHSRDKSLSKSHKESQQNLEHLIKNLKGESDHLAEELYNWIDTHAKRLKTNEQSPDEPRGQRQHLKTHEKTRGRIRLRDKSRDQPHGSARDFSRSKRDVQDEVKLKVSSLSNSRDYPRGVARDFVRPKRRVQDPSGGLEGKSIKDVMFDLMNASPQKNKHKKKKSTITKSKINVKTKRKTLRKTSKNIKAKALKKKTAKSSKKRSFKRVKRIKKNKITKKLKILKPKKGLTKHAPAKSKYKTSLPDLLKVISADPAKKIVVINKEDNVKIDRKNSKIINGIPQSVLRNLIKNINLEKYFKMASFLPDDVKKEKQKIFKLIGKAKAIIKKNSRKVGHKKLNGKDIIKKRVVSRRKKTLHKMPANKANAPSHFVKKMKITKPTKDVLKSSKKVVKIISKTKKKALKLPKVSHHVNPKISIGHQKLSLLKEKIKKTNSLKLKVAKALLKHCETQNQLKHIFENVNKSLREASKLAQAIGKRFGVKQTDIDKLSTEHTEEAVADFLDKIF